MIRYDVEPFSAEWWQLRSEGVGGSEIPGLFREEKRGYGLSAWGLYQAKGEGDVVVPSVAGERARLGSFMEPAIIAATADQEGFSVRSPVYAICDDQPEIRASLDAEADAPPAKFRTIEAWDGIDGPGVIEAKLVSREAVREDFGWNPKAPERPTPPRRFYLQVMHGMVATGWRWGALACLFEGDNLQVYYYRWSERNAVEIRRRVTDLYDRIAWRRPPPMDGNTTTEKAIKQHWRNSNSKHLEIPPNEREEFDRRVLSLESWRETRKHADQKATEDDNWLRYRLGHFETAHGQSQFASLKPNKNGARTTVRTHTKERKTP